jgi:hypothetical protein
MIRMEHKRVAKKPSDCMPGGRRKVGRHRLRWLEDADNDLCELKVRRWSRKPNNREESASALKKAKIRGP